MTTNVGKGGHGSPTSARKRLDRVTIRFAGDSGDGMQLTGNQFTSTAALAGNDLATLPDYPAEIRAPAGTLAGVSGFQIQLGSLEIFTPGDRPDVLVAMNPAALKRNLDDLDRGATIIANSDAFEKRALEKVGFTANPLEDDSLAGYTVIQAPLTTLTREALADSDLTTREKDRSKNFFALGLMYWMYGRSLDYSIGWIEKKFGSKPSIASANITCLKGGHAFGETAGLFANTYEVREAEISPGHYRQITGNEATAFGFIAASKVSGLPLFLGSYPITPASDILHTLSRYKHYGVRTVQAEDEIAAVCAAIGAAFGGAIGLTTTSGPGVALKAEAIGLANIAELPLVVVNVQRGGPSTGLPTKTEQADLLQALYGRNGESAIPIVAPATPGDCFYMAMEATRIAVTYMTPVFLMTDGYLANGAEPWKIPDVGSLPTIEVNFETDPEGFLPYQRDEKTLARPWAIPGTPGLEHRLGGLEKSAGAGNVSYDPANHEHMCKIRTEKVARIGDTIPDAEIFGEDEGDVLLVGWGGTYGAIRAATKHLRADGHRVSHMHIRHLSPMPKNVETTLKRFRTVVCAELNLGQLRRLLREMYLVDVQGLNKIQGQPFKVSEIVSKTQAWLTS